MVDSVRQNQIALAASRQRYKTGLSDFLNGVSSQAQLLQSENDLAVADTEIATDLVALYRALGGGRGIVEGKCVPEGQWRGKPT